MHFLDADGLSGKDLAEVDLFIPPADATAARDHDGFIVEEIVDVRQPSVGTWRRPVDLDRTLHVQSFVRTFVIEDLDKLVEAPKSRPYSRMMVKDLDLITLFSVHFQSALCGQRRTVGSSSMQQGEGEDIIELSFAVTPPGKIDHTSFRT